MDYDDKPHSELDDIETYANHAIHDVRDLQDRLRANAMHLPSESRQFMFDAADALDGVVHDHFAGQLIAVNDAREFMAPSHVAADRAHYHSQVL